MAALRAEGVTIRLVLINRRQGGPSTASVDAVVSDPLGRIFSAWGVNDGAVYVLRPDQHVAARWTSDAGMRVAQVVKKALCRPAASASRLRQPSEALA